MRLLSLSVVTAALLGCSGLFGKSPDPTDSDLDTEDTQDTEDTEDTEELHPYEDCQAWIDCLDAAGDGDASDVDDEYGERGSCWDENAESDCEDACEAGLEDAQDAHPDVIECRPAGCPFLDGTWTFQLEMDGLDADCWNPDFFDAPHDTYVACVDAHAGEFSMTLEGLEFACQVGGDTWTCGLTTTDEFNSTFDLEGRFSSDGVRATGTFVTTYEYDQYCEGSGSFDGSL